MQFSVKGMAFIRVKYTKAPDETEKTFEVLIPDSVAAHMFGYNEDGSITNMPPMDIAHAMFQANGLNIVNVEVYGNCDLLVTSEKMPQE